MKLRRPGRPEGASKKGARHALPLLLYTATPRPLERTGSRATAGYKRPANAGPGDGATQNSQKLLERPAAANRAGPVLRAGFTEVFVTGIPMR